MTDIYAAGLKRGDRENTEPGADTDIAGKAKAMVGDLKSKTSDLTDTVTRTAVDKGEEIASAAKDLASSAQDRLGQAVVEQKSAGADYLGSIAQTIHRAATEFDHELPQAARYIRQASDQVQHFSDAVRDRDARELVAEVQSFARKQPALFFGGAVVLGFAALRFFKSAAETEPTGSRPAPNAFVPKTGD